MAQKYLVFVCAAALIMLSTSMSYSQLPGEEYIWEFNEGSGNTVTDTSGNYSASLGIPIPANSEPVISTDSPSGQAGDSSLVPNGGLYVDDSTTPILDITDGPITIETWFKLESLNSTNDFLSYGDTYKIGINNGNIVWTFRAIEDTFSTIAVSVDDTWHHIAMTWEPGVAVTFYLDGEQASYVETTSQFRDPLANVLNIGSGYQGGSPFPGLLDRVRIHHALLTAAQLDSVASTPKDPSTDTLVAFNFDDTTSPYQSNVNDIVRSGVATATITNQLSAPEFNSVTPSGEDGDYSLNFDGDDRIVYDDNEMRTFDFIDEPFTFQVWLKFKSVEQVSTRPIFFAYGVGGSGGYSFSFRPAPTNKTESVEDSPSGTAGDLSILPVSGLQVSDLTPAVLPGQTDSLTAEAWIKPTTFPEYSDLFRIGDSLKGGFNYDHMMFTFLGVIDIVSENAVIPVDGAWHHIAYVLDAGSKISFYLDGVLADAIDTTDAGRDYTNAYLSIGSAHDGTSLFDGLIDRFRIHKAVLTADQLDSNASTLKDVTGDTVVAYNFDEGQQPYPSSSANAMTASNRGNYLTVTTYGIVDAHSSAEIPDDGLWHHVAAVFDWDGFAFNFFVDKELKASMYYENGVLPAPNNNAYFYVGCEAGGGNPYVGLIDHVRITRNPLTVDELDYFEPENPTSVGNWSLF